ncbi:hypothetical protein GO988_17465 [Hymenobacter sp. HMF4947]|uniref:Uncharacterized protein n=1 Tax=Hymenobacter ginkgonis TaxID=2682976 RepID=A0A7K1TI83_9BACT|nr:hypothetical protein [Hymenobacter ginkgonis]MVN78120.1 hypothetical protein [Hymenobacter ginkgonis]
MSDLDQQRADLPQRGLSTMADLVNLLGLLLPAAKLTPRKAQLPFAESQLHSHFGGMPYFETGEVWCGRLLRRDSRWTSLCKQ